MYKKLLLILNQFCHFCLCNLLLKSFIIFLFIIFLFPQNKSYSSLSAKTFDDYGLISIMYHRFNESKYPSTNIQLEVFKQQLEIIENENIQFIDPKNFKENLYQNKKKKSVTNNR